MLQDRICQKSYKTNIQRSCNGTKLINGYKRIPEPLRRQDHGGKTPEQQLIDGLKLIDREIETMTGQISRGELDKLATRGRFLEIRYDGAGDSA